MNKVGWGFYGVDFSRVVIQEISVCYALAGLVVLLLVLLAILLRVMVQTQSWVS
jgi:Mg2+ and Co2+ transporter CorA